MDEPPQLRLAELVMALDRRQVRYLIVGGVAGRLHGATRTTQDLDICPATDAGNLERLAAALDDLGARLVLAPEFGDVVVAASRELIVEFSATRWHTQAGQIDVLLAIKGESDERLGFNDLELRAVTVRLADATIVVAALQDIVRSKEAAGRPKDLEALPELRALLGSPAADGQQLSDEPVRRVELPKPPVPDSHPVTSSRASRRHASPRRGPSIAP